MSQENRDELIRKVVALSLLIGHKDKRIAGLEAALEFYADTDSWNHRDNGSKANYDAGQIAQTALDKFGD